MREAMMDYIRTHLIIEGRVQGVFFRDSTRRVAIELGLKGWVKNRFDGAVEVVAEGPKENVEKLVEWCHYGPPSARVTRVHEIKEEYTEEFDSFRIAF
jgi:acylphosphatase